MYAFFFFNDTATTEIYTLSLHDALPISASVSRVSVTRMARATVEITMPQMGESVTEGTVLEWHKQVGDPVERSEEHTSELQSRQYLVCRLLLEKKKTNDDAM